MSFESVSGRVLQRQRNARSDGDRVTQVKCSKWSELTRTAPEKHFHHYSTLSVKKKKKKSLNLLWRYSESEPHTAGRKTASDLIGGGMCQIVVELYVKVGQRTEGKYWFLGRFTWHVYPVVMTGESDVTFVHQDSADKDTNGSSDILKCLHKMKNGFHELFRSSNHLLSKKPIRQKWMICCFSLFEYLFVLWRVAWTGTRIWDCINFMIKEMMKLKTEIMIIFQFSDILVTDESILKTTSSSSRYSDSQTVAAHVFLALWMEMSVDRSATLIQTGIS